MTPFRSFVGWILLAAVLFTFSNCGSDQKSQDTDTSPPENAPVLVSLAPTVAQPLPVGLSQQFSASVYFADGTGQEVDSGVTWASSDGAVVTVDAAGMVTAQGIGAATVTATYQGLSSAGTPVEVTSATLDSLSLELMLPSLAAGFTTSVQAYGHFSDGTTMEITSGVTFGTVDGAVATINGSGVISALAVGATNVTADYGGKSASIAFDVTSATLESLSVIPVVTSLLAGLTTQLSVFANYSDGTSVQVTSGIAFSSLTTGLASVSSLGLVTGLGAGSATIQASYGGETGTVEISVSAPALQSLALQIGTGSLAAGLTTQLSVTAHYSNGDDVQVASGVTFTSSNPVLAGVNGSGLVTAIAATASPVTLTASFGGQSATATVSVSSALLESISVSAAAGSIAAGLSTRVTVTGHYSDASTAILSSGVSFSSSLPTLAAVNSSGLVTGLLVGSPVITASYGGFTDSVSINVTNPVLNSITVTTSSPLLHILLAQTAQLTVTAHYSDGTNPVITSNATYSSNNSFLSISLLGVVIALTPGTTTFTATFGGQTDTVDVEAQLL